jgi:hypothetical protein
VAFIAHVSSRLLPSVPVGKPDHGHLSNSSWLQREKFRDPAIQAGSITGDFAQNNARAGTTRPRDFQWQGVAALFRIRSVRRDTAALAHAGAGSGRSYVTDVAVVTLT